MLVCLQVALGRFKYLVFFFIFFVGVFISIFEVFSLFSAPNTFFFSHSKASQIVLRFRILFN